MSVISKETLKIQFDDGSRPIGSDFENLLDSYYHQQDAIPMSGITGLADALAAHQLTLNFIQLETFVFTQGTNYKITSISSQTGVVPVIKLSGTSTDYILGDTITAYEKLDISVNTTGAITLYYTRL